MRYATHLLDAGAVYVSAPPGADRRAQQLAQIDPRVVVVFPQTAHLLPETTAPVVAVGPVAGVPERLDELAAAQSSAPLASRSHLADLGTVLSSGGTTGIPKSSVRDVAAWAAAVATPHRPERRQLASGPEAYLTQILVAQTLIGGGTVVLRDDSDPAALLASIEAERITDLFLVEPQLVALMDHPDVGRRDLSSLRTLTHIGASAPPTLRRRAVERLAQVLQHTYGASEIGIVSALRPADYDPSDPERATCAGTVLPGVEVRFRRDDGTLDPATGRSRSAPPPWRTGTGTGRSSRRNTSSTAGTAPATSAASATRAACTSSGAPPTARWTDGRLVTPTGIEDTLMRPARRCGTRWSWRTRSGARRSRRCCPGVRASTSRPAGTPWPPSTAGRSPTRWSSSAGGPPAHRAGQTRPDGAAPAGELAGELSRAAVARSGVSAGRGPASRCARPSSPRRAMAWPVRSTPSSRIAMGWPSPVKLRHQVFLSGITTPMRTSSPSCS